MDIITRAEAKAQGLTYYFTGKPCKNGHIAQKNVCDYGCRECRETKKAKRRELGLDREQARLYSQRYRAADPDRARAQSMAHEAKRAANPVICARRNELARLRRLANPQVALRQKQAKQARAHLRREHERQRYQQDIDYKLTKCLRSRLHAIVRRGLGQKHGSTFALLGCSLEELRAHLEAQFSDGMSWANYGEWHVDHIRPCARFDLTDPAQQRECFHWSNLQPLWAEENIRKGAKLVA
jgi:hypothetical protein